MTSFSTGIIAQINPIAETSLYDPPNGACFDTSTVPCASAAKSACDSQWCPLPSTVSAWMVMRSFGASPSARIVTTSSAMARAGVISKVCAAPSEAAKTANVDKSLIKNHHKGE
jgi:hypothetical protein